MQTCTLAVDIGASSGRHIVGTVQDGRIVLQEVYRFENGVRRKDGHLCWDIDTLAREVINGLRAAHDAGFAPATIGIDTWAVDFVLLDEAGQRIGDAVAYRDERTEGIREALEKEYGLTFAEHYARTGIQYQPFNTVYQLMALKKEHPEQLAAAKTFLMVPDYLNYLLCGVAANEYTNASTTALVGADSKDWDDALLQRLGLPRGIFQPIKTAGTVLGHLTPAVQAEVGFDAEVILPATARPFWRCRRGTSSPPTSPAAHGACSASKTRAPSPTPRAAPPTLQTRAATSTATAISRTSWACG